MDCSQLLFIGTLTYVLVFEIHVHVIHLFLSLSKGTKCTEIYIKTVRFIEIARLT